jgi:phenylacetate-CoA ligase
MSTRTARPKNRLRLNPGPVAEPFDDLDRLTPNALVQWWVRRLRRVLKSAAADLPFYARRFAQAGFYPADFRGLADLQRVPILTKADLLAAQAHGGSHRVGIEQSAGGAQARTILSLSSGTSGTTYITHTARWRRLQGLASSRAHWWAGLRPGRPMILSAPAWHSYAAIQPFIVERFGLDCVVVSGTYLPRFADRIVDALLRFRPRFVTMFLPMVFAILSAALRQGIEGRRLFAGVDALLVTGAPITPGMRAHLQDLTRVGRVAELAGSSENLLAVDCARGAGLHLVPDTCYAQVLDPRSLQPVADGVRGTIVHSCTVPAGSLYLRYRGGDMGVMDHAPCPCGLPSPRIQLLGREEDSFSLGSQTLLPFDVQLALEEEVPELAGVACVITRESLAQGRLRLLLLAPQRSAATLLDGARIRLARRFAVPVEIATAPHLPLRFKGVPPILSESEADAAT